MLDLDLCRRLPSFHCFPLQPKHLLLTKPCFSERLSFKTLEAGETISLGRFFQQLIAHVLKMYVYLLIWICLALYKRLYSSSKQGDL